MAVVEEEEELLRLRPGAGESDGAESRPRSAMSTYSCSEEVNEILTKLKKVAETQNPEYQDNLRLFVQEWKEQTTKEAAGLEKLKKRVQKRKVIRAEEDKLLAEMKEREEELRLQEAEESKIRKQEEKMRRIEAAETKRQKLLEESKEKKNYTIQTTGREIRKEEESLREPTKEEIEAMKQAALSVRIKPLGIEGLHKERLKRRAVEVWEQLVKIESERYDLEERQRRQEYDLRELKERQKQQLRSRAMKLGLPPEALTGKYPPKIMVASKYERRAGLKPFGETKDLFEGGFMKQYRDSQDKTWKDRQDLFTKKEKDQMPPWLEDMPPRTRLEDSEDEDDEDKVKAKIAQETQQQKEAEVEEEAVGAETEEEEEEEEVEESEAEEEEVEEEEVAPENPDVILEDPEGEAKAEAEIAEESEEEEEEEEEESEEEED